ncbi:amino acid ABC transporter permease [Nesterenkonia aurantiaca]|uniref:Amino acid ABC transporter membrane protein (PAAT family) n=1 Tax=Nesterenkonia aurantiaca TaxID=1436010 RepID=A0A4R7G8S7_9MICC|nr:amino acid ABC transporter permease [Nesterenkonia aurantiaca]TDS87779.1 amino acid ABC transporter membrane protein (PAAT family) [Nesterenkonia aurantiaca]
MQFDPEFFTESLFSPSAPFLRGLMMTVAVSVISMTLALFVGLLVAMMARSRFFALRTVAGLYVWILRGTPLLVQLVLLYMGFSAAGIFAFETVSIAGISIAGAVQAAVVALTLNESAYVAEIVRSGLETIPKGQVEASQILGMTAISTMRWVILPQAIRTMVPPLGNTFNQLMKNTSILSVIGVQEMFLMTQSISSATFRTFEIFCVAALYYLLLTTIWTVIQWYIERHYNHKVGLPYEIPLVSSTVRVLRSGRAGLARSPREETPKEVLTP